jgi:hypothetical protein
MVDILFLRGGKILRCKETDAETLKRTVLIETKLGIEATTNTSKANVSSGSYYTSSPGARRVASHLQITIQIAIPCIRSSAHQPVLLHLNR